MGSKSAGSSTTTQKADPWSGIQPFLVGGGGEKKLKEGVQPVYTTQQVQTGINRDGDPIYTTQQTQTNPESDYYTTDGSPGIYPEAAKLYQANGWDQNQQGATDAQLAALRGRGGQTTTATGVANSILSGSYNPSITAASITQPTPINGVSAIQTPTIAAPQLGELRQVGQRNVDLTGARQSQGELDPTAALSQILQGKIDQPYLDQLQQASTNRAMIGYNDAVDNATQALLPAIRSGAIASGGYGGTRQGIAEGLVGQQLAKNARDLGINAQDAGTQLYSRAYDNAQNQQYGAATGLNDQAVATATNNANRAVGVDQFNSAQALDAMKTNAQLGLNAATANAGNSLAAQQFNNNQALGTQQFNAQLGLQGQQLGANTQLQNNSQQFQLQNQNLGNQLQGLNTLNIANGFNDQTYQQIMAALNAPKSYNQQNLSNYAGIITPGAGAFQSQTTETPLYSNPLASVVGLGLTGLSVAGGLGWKPF